MILSKEKSSSTSWVCVGIQYLFVDKTNSVMVEVRLYSCLFCIIKFPQCCDFILAASMQDTQLTVVVIKR